MAVKHLIRGTRAALGLPPESQFVNHVVLAIFPRMTNTGRMVVDEKCSCNHPRSNHMGENPLNAGRGRCSVDFCECMKFTWAKNVFGRISKRRRA